MILQILNLNFYNYLNDIDYLNCCYTCKEMLLTINENIYYNLLKNKFSEKFVNDAKFIINTWEECYYRVLYFEYLMIRYSCELWTEKEYILYWKNCNCNLSNRDMIYRNYYKNYKSKYYSNKL